LYTTVVYWPYGQKSKNKYREVMGDNYYPLFRTGIRDFS